MLTRALFSLVLLLGAVAPIAGSAGESKVLALGLSDHEVSQGARDDVDDPSVFIKFLVTGESVAGSDSPLAAELKGANLLAWTTTPSSRSRTLTSNGSTNARTPAWSSATTSK